MKASESKSSMGKVVARVRAVWKPVAVAVALLMAASFARSTITENAAQTAAARTAAGRTAEIPAAAIAGSRGGDSTVIEEAHSDGGYWYWLKQQAMDPGPGLH